MSIKPFKLNISEAVIEDLNLRLENAKWPARLGTDPWSEGADLAFMKRLTDHWKTRYDWREQETALNRLDHYVCQIDGVDLHFVHQKGKGPNPMPVILTHGWPDSFLRYVKLIPRLTDPESFGRNAFESFDVVIPSIPGFGFSPLPDRKGLDNAKVSDLWLKLMTKLGYERFFAAGGDIGSGITRHMAATAPHRLMGIYLTDIGIIKPLLGASDPLALSPDEQAYVQEAQQWLAAEGAYIAMQATKPQTLSFGLSDSPVGLAAWLIEKFRAWSGCHGNLEQLFSMDELITQVMVYWVTNSAGTAAQIYYENAHSTQSLPAHIDVPTAIACFPADILPPPKSWVMAHFNVQAWYELPHGGHFTALEAPELMAETLIHFCRTVVHLKEE